MSGMIEVGSKMRELILPAVNIGDQGKSHNYRLGACAVCGSREPSFNDLPSQVCSGLMLTFPNLMGNATQRSTGPAAASFDVCPAAGGKSVGHVVNS